MSNINIAVFIVLYAFFLVLDIVKVTHNRGGMKKSFLIVMYSATFLLFLVIAWGFHPPMPTAWINNHLSPIVHEWIGGTTYVETDY